MHQKVLLYNSYRDCSVCKRGSEELLNVAKGFLKTFCLLLGLRMVKNVEKGWDRQTDTIYKQANDAEGRYSDI